MIAPYHGVWSTNLELALGRADVSTPSARTPISSRSSGAAMYPASADCLRRFIPDGGSQILTSNLARKAILFDVVAGHVADAGRHQGGPLRGLPTTKIGRIERFKDRGLIAVQSILPLASEIVSGSIIWVPRTGSSFCPQPRKRSNSFSRHAQQAFLQALFGQTYVGQVTEISAARVCANCMHS